MAAIALDEGGDPAPFVRRTGNGEASLELLVTGAHCANCIARIELTLTRLAGVTAARLNLSTGKLLVSWRDGALAPGTFLDQLRNWGLASGRLPRMPR